MAFWLENKVGFSPKRAIELTHNMYEVEYVLPNVNEIKKIVLKMDPEQEMLRKIIHEK